jgi:putative redox protein
MTSRVTYISDLRTECEHLRSGNTFITDAPVDNNGKGAAFSPTDTLATAVASCMLTVMGIKAATLHLQLDGSTAEVTKFMASDPRRISKVKVVISMSLKVDLKTQKILEKTALTCPVINSLNPEIEKEIIFNWQ